MTHNVPKITSGLAVLDVKKGRKKLVRYIEKNGDFVRATLRQEVDIPVTITGRLKGEWSSEDGISQEFEIAVDEVKLGEDAQPAAAPVVKGEYRLSMPFWVLARKDKYGRGITLGKTLFVSRDDAHKEYMRLVLTREVDIDDDVKAIEAAVTVLPYSGA